MEQTMTGVVKTLERAIGEAATLPEADQEKIGRQLLAHVEKLQKLRREIDLGVRSLEAGKGRPLDIEQFLKAQNAKHGRS
jgi:hypothetical protein